MQGCEIYRRFHPRRTLLGSCWHDVRVQARQRTGKVERALRSGVGKVAQAPLVVPTIFMAEPISAETSVMLLGTISVVVASAATLP